MYLRRRGRDGGAAWEEAANRAKNGATVTTASVTLSLSVPQLSAITVDRAYNTAVDVVLCAATREARKWRSRVRKSNTDIYLTTLCICSQPFAVPERATL